MSRYLTGAAKVLDELEKNRRSEVYGNIGRETFEKICKEERTIRGLIEMNIVETYIDPCKPLEDFSEKKWISKEEALKIWPDRTDPALDCTKEKCRCKSRKKENEGLKRKEMGNE